MLDLPDELRSQLKKDGWTVDNLATTDPALLTGYKGIDFDLATQIIQQAQAIVNERLLDETMQLEAALLPDDDCGRFDIPFDPTDPMVMIKMQRIRLAYQQGRL